MPLSLSAEQFEVFVLVLVRTSALLFSVPILGAQEVPRIAKIGMSLMLAWIIAPAVGLPAGTAAFQVEEFVPAVIGEVLVGVLIGLSARIIFEGIQIGGQLVGFQMGFGIVNVMDPITGANFSIIAQIQNLLAVLLFITLGLHHLFIKAVFASFTKIPLLHCAVPGTLVEWFARTAGNIFTVGLKVAAPTMALLLFVSAGMGIINKAAQGMNVMIVMFPLKIAVGLFGVALTMPMFVVIAQKSFRNLEEYIAVILKLAGTQ